MHLVWLHWDGTPGSLHLVSSVFLPMHLFPLLILLYTLLRQWTLSITTSESCETLRDSPNPRVFLETPNMIPKIFWGRVKGNPIPRRFEEKAMYSLSSPEGWRQGHSSGTAGAQGWQQGTSPSSFLLHHPQHVGICCGICHFIVWRCLQCLLDDHIFTQLLSQKGNKTFIHTCTH